jgi:hypothetical protein
VKAIENNNELIQRTQFENQAVIVVGEQALANKVERYQALTAEISERNKEKADLQKELKQFLADIDPTYKSEQTRESYSTSYRIGNKTIALIGKIRKTLNKDLVQKALTPIQWNKVIAYVEKNGNKGTAKKAYTELLHSEFVVKEEKTEE